MTQLPVPEGRNPQLHYCDNLETHKSRVSKLCKYNGVPQLSKDFILPPPLVHFDTCLRVRNTFTPILFLKFYFVRLRIILCNGCSLQRLAVHRFRLTVLRTRLSAVTVACVTYLCHKDSTVLFFWTKTSAVLS